MNLFFAIGTFRVENSTVIQMKIQTKFEFEFEHGLPRHLVKLVSLNQLVRVDQDLS